MIHESTNASPTNQYPLSATHQAGKSFTMGGVFCAHLDGSSIPLSTSRWDETRAFFAASLLLRSQRHAEVITPSRPSTPFPLLCRDISNELALSDGLPLQIAQAAPIPSVLRRSYVKVKKMNSLFRDPLISILTADALRAGNSYVF